MPSLAIIYELGQKLGRKLATDVQIDTHTGDEWCKVVRPAREVSKSQSLYTQDQPKQKECVNSNIRSTLMSKELSGEMSLCE